jgi:hypothetical protein
VVWIVEAGESVGDDLSCGFGGGFGGLLVGELLGSSRLGLGGGCSCGKIVLGRERQSGLGGGDDEDLFELVEVRSRAKLNEGVGLVVGVGFNGLDSAHREAPGIDLIAAGGEDLLADLNAGVGREIVDHDLAGAATTKNGAKAGGGKENAGAGGLVVDEQNLRGVREDVAEFSDDSIGRDNGLIGLEAVLGAFVDVEDAGEVVSTGADDLSGDGGGDVVLLEIEQGLKTVALNGVFGERGLLEAEPGNLLLEIVILLTGVAEIDVVGPAVTEVVAEAMEEPLEGSDGRDGPVTENGDAAAVGSTGFDGTSHLDGKPDGLGKQNRDQDEDILETCEERFHCARNDYPRIGDCAEVAGLMRRPLFFGVCEVVSGRGEGRRIEESRLSRAAIISAEREAA